jgi:hypothetical protein
MALIQEESQNFMNMVIKIAHKTVITPRTPEAKRETNKIN